MSYEEKYQKALAELEASGIRKAHYLPVGHRISKHFGSQSRPPHYNTFYKNAFSMGIWFTVGWGIGMWILVWRHADKIYSEAITAAGFAGMIFGLAMGCFYKFMARKNNLSDWDDL
ncbi:hypothetical protein F9L33_05685 [Amylibacter sp. SFDW26]|uniref:DUF6404 family protein n=1 Tax=Amylibacter sp. SFDW26 TaxID=2652722 RepID=UPI00126197F3|nr:DUF6404 family protein [Amylibacter sp. SFDW26]KAB7616240.1 hypothetical protein F9L33_05685 [Amylibacter sp. SFDW26]